MNIYFKRLFTENLHNNRRLYKEFAFVVFTIFFFASCASCKKDAPLPEFYFTCKINGQVYVPNSCANCRVAKILGDTTFLLNGNNGFESVSFGIIKLDHIPIQVNSYTLNTRQQSGGYKNSTTVNDEFNTDSVNIGTLNISELDKTQQIIKGSFSFKGYNAYRNQTAIVSDGIFRLKYSIY